MKIQRLHSLLYVICLGAVLQLFFVDSASAACAGTRTWVANANTTVWTTTTNWSPNNAPDTNVETAYVKADWQIPTYPAANYTLSCLEINSGSMTAAAANNVTIVDDYFRNLNVGALIVPGGSTWEVIMGGTATQSFENYDTIPKLTLNNGTTVNLTKPFTVSNTFTINSGAGNINIQGNLETQQTTAITIPSSATVTLAAGVQWKVNGGLTVNGTLILMPGSKLLLANTRTLSIGSTGTLQIAGTSGSAAVIDAYNSSSTFTFNVIGKINASYFSINRTGATGVNITGQLLDFSNGVVNYIPNGGFGLTLGVGSTSSATSLSGVGFYGQTAATPKNVNATSYTGSVITFNNYSGVGGAADETDPSNKITWGSAAAVELLLTNNSPSGAPPTTIARSSAYTHFATFSFALSGVSTASDITSIKFTIDGTNSSSDITGVRVYKDADNNCTYNAGVDAQVGGTYTPAGSPATFTATFSSGDIQVSSTSPRCVHVLLSTSAVAGVNNTLGIKIAATDDVVNSQTYSLSATSAPPVSAGVATVSGTAILRWNGGNGTTMAQANNWTVATIPTSALDCQIGSGYSVPIKVVATFSCLNTQWVSGGSINWNNTAGPFAIYGAFTGSTGFTFTSTTTAAIMNFAGTTAQSVNFNGMTFPGSVQINNTTGPVTFDSNATISGSLTLNGGTTRIASGVTLTVSGNIAVNSPATLDIEPGATLKMGNGTTITVALGGTLEMIGTSSTVTNLQAINNASSFTVAVSGTIKAQYYTVKNLGVTGLTVNAGATIDPTYSLKNGSFSYPGANSSTMLRLLRQVPGNTLDSMTFDTAGSTATSVLSISTNTSAGTLNMTNYSGDMTGNTFSSSTLYIITWVSPTNTIDLTQESIAPASLNQGDVTNMGRFGFQQTSAGAFANTDITYMRLTLTGTASASDVSSVSLYFDSACTGSGGTLIGSQTFSGSPARADFTGITGATIPFSLTAPPKRCFYVMYNISSTATNGATIGVQIQSSSHVTNSQNYAFNGAAGPAVSLGTSTIIGTTTYWTGTTSTAWATAGNWNGGLPTSSLNCVINSATNNPIISTGVASCKTLTIGTGNLTMTGGQLEVYGSFSNTGTFTQGGFPLVIRDNGVTASAQTVTSSSTLDNISFNKTAGGTVDIGGSTLTVTSLINFTAGNTFTFNVGASKTLSAIAGITVSAGSLSVDDGGTVEIGASQTLTLSGGSVIATGTNDAYPQSLSTKGTFTRRGGSGTWNFTATSGTLNLVGFVFEWLGTSGLNIGGTTNVTQINGGQLRSLPTTAGMRAIQLNTTGSLPTTISNFGWYWGTGNSVPAEGASYFLGYSSGCSNRTVTFDQWFGDFWPYTSTNTDAKISETSCNIVIDRANSPVSLTEFKATPYNGQVVLEWTTGLEWYHKGFNIYRSLSPSSGFTQINPEIIRNDLFNTNMHATYAFIDEDVVNGVTYYYKLEDISITEERTLHGPVSASPALALGAAPPPLASTIVSNSPSGSQSAGGSGASTTTPGMVELEPNVLLEAKTQSSYRLKITIPAYTSTADATHPSYNHLSIPLFSKTIAEGQPELLTRTLMLKIPEATSAQMDIVSEVSNVNAGVLVAPAPEWVLNGSQYEYQWTLDSAAYSSGSYNPTQPIELGTIINNEGQHYLPVIIKPLSYLASSQDLKKYNEIVIDIFLDNKTTWAPSQPVSLSELWGTEGALRIGLSGDGVYQVTYDDMLAAGVIAPFDHGDVTKFKLYFMNQEHPLDVYSNSGLFSTGDSIRFFAANTVTIESANSYVLLVPDYASPTPGLRMTEVDVSTPAGTWTSNSGFTNQVHLEENNVAIFNEPYDQDMDLFVWGLYYGIAGSTTVPLTTDVQLPYLLNTGTVTVQATIKSRATTSTNYQSELKLYVNNTVAGTFSFSGSDVQVATFDVDSQYFIQGKNKLTLEPTGAHLISGEYDMVYIDSIDVYYKQDWIADEDQILIENNQPSVDIPVDNFSSNNLFVYDLSQFGNAQKWINASTSLNSVYSVQLKTPVDPNLGRRIWISTAAKLLAPSSMELNYGSHLASTANEADVIYVGSPELLDAVEPLAALREEQGYKTSLVSLQSIYNEFGQGVVSHEAIRDFFIYAYDNWSVKPKYFILLGDGTYDPKAYQNDEILNRFPVKLMKGVAFNYGSDHWFVTRSGEDLPFAIVGRIPARTPEELNNYVAKVLDYEAGTLKPSPAMTVLSDKAHYEGENFDSFTGELVTSVKGWNSKLSVSSKSRTALGDSAFKTKVIDSFSNSSLIHYMGHGAENMWGDNNIFNNNDVDTLTNSKLPIVAAMDCLNANFYDPSSISLAEKLVMKKQGGAIVFWGSTSITPPSIQDIYQKAFYERILKATKPDIGSAVKLSKAQAHEESPYEEAILSWTIIGDPMIQASLPTTTSTTKPPTTASNGGSRGCSVFGASSKDLDSSTSWDLFFALLLESLIALAVIKSLVRLSQRKP